MSDCISEDNLVHILKLLPVKTILRFRCICKRWKEVIDSTEFIQEHLAVQNPRFLVECGGELDFVAIELRNPPLVHSLGRSPVQGRNPIQGQEFFLLGTLHGVVCLYDWGCNIVLWNPSIRKSLSIPLPSGFDKWGIRDGWTNCYGFWIDPATREFKILILLFHRNKPANTNGILYSSITHDWSVIPSLELGRNWDSDHPGPPIMIEGVAYWRGHTNIPNPPVVIGGVPYHSSRPFGVILSFDFGQERFELIDLPNIQWDCSYIQPITWKGSFSLLLWHVYPPHSCVIYMRQEGSWIKALSFNIFCHTAVYFSVLMLGDMEERFWVLCKTRPRYIFPRVDGECVFDLTLYGRRVGCIPLMDDVRFRSVAFDFVESILFP